MAKTVGSCIYVHKSNIGELYAKVAELSMNKLVDVEVAVDQINKKNFKYEVIKYDKQKHQITFIDSPDWIEANEPEVGDGWMLKMYENWTWKFIKKRNKNPQIYHCKYLFVASDYTGFDIEEAKRREAAWNSIPGIKDVKKFIGNKDYWVGFLGKNGMEV